MYHASSLLFVIFLYVIFVNGSNIPLVDHQDSRDGSVYDRPCPDGLPGRVTQIQQQSLARPAIFTTDCSPSRNNTLTNSNPFEISTLDKRQAQLCSADCSDQCSGDIGGPSASDCTNLANQLNMRNTQFIVSGSQTISMTYGTCIFQLVNTVSSPFSYCDTNWATRSTGVVNSCLPQSSGGMCQGSQFRVVVAVNNLAPTPFTVAPSNMITDSTTELNPATTNASNSNSASGNTAGSNTVSSSAPSGALPTPNGSQSRGSGSHTTTLSNSSVLVPPTASSAPGGSSKTTSSTNVPAVVGAVLGLILLLALISLLLLWRWKKRAQRQLASLGVEIPLRKLSMARVINADPRLHDAPVLGSENGADISETPMTEAVAGGPVWITRNKARMYAEEAMSGTRDTDLSSIEPSTYTTPNALTESPPASVYQIQSSNSRREMKRGRHGHRILGRSRDHPRPQQTGNASSHRDRGAYAFDSHPTLPGSSNSMSARKFAQVAAPNLSPSDIDRLAESIVTRMQGRDSALRERIVEEAESSIATEDEPPPPWSAPGVDAHGL